MATQPGTTVILLDFVANGGIARPSQRGTAFPSVGSFALFTNKYISLTPAPGQMAATPDLARWTPVVMSFGVPAGYKAVVAAKIGADSALWMEVYDEVMGGLAPLFQDRTTVTITGNDSIGRIFTMSILPDGGWQRPNVQVEAYFGQVLVP